MKHSVECVASTMFSMTIQLLSMTICAAYSRLNLNVEFKVPSEFNIFQALSLEWAINTIFARRFIVKASYSYY